jgi:hypothetical protein
MNTKASQAELQFPGDIERGDDGDDAKRVQEWLCLHDTHVGIDSGFGPATETAVTQFQSDNSLPSTGVVDQATFDALVQPMRNALEDIQPDGMSLGELVVAYARQHLAEGPMEEGGDNRGPWVRLYMDGIDGVDEKWCAGFATFILNQACATLNQKLPVVRAFACDVIANDAAKKRILKKRPSKPGDLFLVLRSNGTHAHIGIVTGVGDEAFQTIEGNTNEDGSANGFEVAARTRSYDAKQFVVI